MSDVIDTTDFDLLPDEAFYQLFVPMICPHCSDIHGMPVPPGRGVPKEGLAKLVEMIQQRLIAHGYRVPTKEEFAAFIAKRAAEAKTREEFAERIKSQGGSSFYIQRTPREGGDA